jgi:hypothetical protein
LAQAVNGINRQKLNVKKRERVRKKININKENLIKEER